VQEQPLEGIAAADARLGTRFPLPYAPMPLARWVEVVAVGSGSEVIWNLDDTRPGAPARIALYAGREPPPARELPDAVPAVERDGRSYRTAPLDNAQPSLRPVHELSWRADGLYLRLTAQGPWETATLEAIAQSVPSA
jgi:hypothetical protein